MTTIAMIADTHGFMPPPPPCDLVLLSGDIGPDGTDEEQKHWFLTEMARWLEQCHAPVVAVPGNHDHILFLDRDITRKLPWTFIADATTEQCGLKIHGFPWVPLEKNTHWHLMEQYIHSQVEAIPDGIDILLLHAAPYGFGDRMNHDCHQRRERCGYAALRSRLHRTKLAVCGHNHNSRGCWQLEGTTIVNATTGYNGSVNGRGFRGEKPHSWWILQYDHGVGPKLLNGEQDVFPFVPGEYEYDRVGIGKRGLVLEPDGSISRGAARMEMNWRIRYTNRFKKPTLIISGDQEDCMHLVMEDENTWKGRWDNYEKNDVILKRQTV